MFEDKVDEFRSQLEAQGVAYLPYYDHEPDYGITLHDPETIKGHMAEVHPNSIRMVQYTARGWDDHQDVWAFQKKNT
jgi:hypothetical protein